MEIWRDDIHVWYFSKQIYDFLEIFCHRSPKNSLSVISLKYFFNDLFKIHGLWILLNYCLWSPWNTFFMIFHKHFVYDLPKILCLCSPKNILSMISLKISIKISLKYMHVYVWSWNICLWSPWNILFTISLNTLSLNSLKTFGIRNWDFFPNNYKIAIFVIFHWIQFKSSQ